MSERYEFEGFVLERSQRRVLRADGSELTLTPRHFSALLLFVENAGVLLDKDTLMGSLWPGLVVEDNNLSQTVSSLRRALGEQLPGSRFIQTVARQGFRFIAPVRVLDGALTPGPASPQSVPNPPLPSAFRPGTDMETPPTARHCSRRCGTGRASTWRRSTSCRRPWSASSSS